MAIVVFAALILVGGFFYFQGGSDSAPAQAVESAGDAAEDAADEASDAGTSFKLETEEGSVGFESE
ncbi:MAG: hypothetical protein CMN28_05725 [Salinisphaeraceae bacterium]|nr:hypothetical protein [Salinisphaeraceae bacterium]